MMGIAGLAGDPANPPHFDNDVLMPPLPLGKSASAMARGFNAQGWHWWPSDAAIATQEHDGRAPCINLGACLSGCAQGAKASMTLNWAPRNAPGIELRTRCRVCEITLMDAGMANGV